MTPSHISAPLPADLFGRFFQSERRDHIRREVAFIDCHQLLTIDDWATTPRCIGAGRMNLRAAPAAERLHHQTRFMAAPAVRPQRSRPA